MKPCEAEESYGIPLETLRRCESLGWCGEGRFVRGIRQYDDEELARLRLVMTLAEAGFDQGETEGYMGLLLAEEETGAQRLRMLERKRRAALEEIHCREKQINRLDELRYELGHSEKHKQRSKASVGDTETRSAIKQKG